MEEKAQVQAELQKFWKLRSDFLAYLDETLPKEKNGLAFDFTQHPTLDAKQVYELFFKMDYQGRKIGGLLVKAHGITPQ